MTASELVELVKREFPGWSAEEYDGGVRLWPGSEPWEYAPKLALIDIKALVAFGLDGPSKDLDLADPLSALEYATGETALSRRTAPEPEPTRKDFTTKPRLDLIPPGVLARHVLPVLHDGATKHGRDHWKGCTRREYALAAATHILSYLDGEETDESGHEALAHAAADLLLGLGVQP